MKKSFLIFSLVLVFIFCGSFSNAQNNDSTISGPPKIYLHELKIEKLEEGIVTGSFKVLNIEEYFVNDLKYVIYFYKGAEFESLQLIDTNISKETFFVAPGEEITKNFTYEYSPDIQSGEYTIQAKIMTERGQHLGWDMEKIYLTGSNIYLDILKDSGKVIVNENNFVPLEGVQVAHTEDVFINFSVKNNGAKITATPHIKVYNRQTTMPVAIEYNDQQITFEANKTIEVNLLLPKLEKPESYLAEIKFNSENNETISGIQYARWVVKGDGGKILYVKIDRDYFKAGETIDFSVETIGPAEMIDIGEGNVEVLVVDKNGNEVGNASVKVPLSFYATVSNISIPIKTDLLSPTIYVKLTKDGKILDERMINIPEFSEESKQLQKEINNKIARQKLITTILTILSIVIIIAGIIFFSFKFYKKFKTT